MAEELRPRALVPVPADSGLPAEAGDGGAADGSLPGVSPRLQDDLEAALRREQQRRRRSREEATANITEREGELEARASDLDARERRVAETLQSTRELGVRIEAEARANAE